ncbi:hypothetical protein E3P99_03150 [Wallemia hederae]|uniref:U6 snRNA phosphodiesterase 1 n=1 Tax=Wallemia hederae TaxID=1540922 RepID=A0A4T0FJE3_9BASI|nr:hypothetical protein E3P99_03150 [Wallemia hederae]
MLVDYSSDSDQEGVKNQNKNPPQLPAQFKPNTPNDDPAQHQGRTRSRPFMEGVYWSHVQLSVPLEYTFKSILKEIHNKLHSTYSSLHSLYPSDDDEDGDGYLSLSRPLALRHHQLGTFVGQVKDICKQQTSITISFSNLSVLYNDNKTRAFIVMPVVAGYTELRGLLERIDTGPVSDHHQEPYYHPPIFHVSIAWSLTSDLHSLDAFEEVVAQVSQLYQRRLRMAGAVDCSIVNVKIAKNVHSFELSG